jgi:hypothetical protein
VAIWTAALLVAGLVGLTRLYLSAHWLTDVPGRLRARWAWLFAVLTAARTVEGFEGRRQHTLATCHQRAIREPVAGRPAGTRPPSSRR